MSDLGLGTPPLSKSHIFLARLRMVIRFRARMTMRRGIVISSSHWRLRKQGCAWLVWRGEEGRGGDLIRTPSNAIIRIQLTNRSTISAILRSKVSAILRHFIFILRKDSTSRNWFSKMGFFLRERRRGCSKIERGNFWRNLLYCATRAVY